MKENCALSLDATDYITVGNLFADTEKILCELVKTQSARRLCTSVFFE